jgi:ribosomal protein S18 acetylase RimI-like enzyme
MASPDGPRLTLRPVTAGDRDFLRALYASTRAEEMALVGWDEDRQRAFVAMQFDAQQQHYAAHHPGADHSVVLRDGVPAGQIHVDRTGDVIQVVDLVIAPGHRAAGIGTALLRALMDEGRRVRLHVETFNRARRLYERLGFRVTALHGIHHEMEFVPADGEQG